MADPFKQFNKRNSGFTCFVFLCQLLQLYCKKVDKNIFQIETLAGEKIGTYSNYSHFLSTIFPISVFTMLEFM